MKIMIQGLKRFNRYGTTKAVINGREAIEALEAESFDLVILDLIMPRMDGFNTLEEIKDKGIKVKVIILSTLEELRIPLKSWEDAFSAPPVDLKSPLPIQRIFTIISPFFSFKAVKWTT